MHFQQKEKKSKMFRLILLIFSIRFARRITEICKLKNIIQFKNFLAINKLIHTEIFPAAVKKNV